MSYANGTEFYNLPQTVGTDKRDWFDTNAAFAAVDAALHAAATGQAADAEAISTINSKLAADEADIAALQTASSTQAASISTLQTTVNGQATQIADVRQDTEDMISAYNEGAAETSTHAYAIGDYFIYNDVLYKATSAIAIGDTIVPNTNCKATNVATELESVATELGSVATELGSVETNLGTLEQKVKTFDYHAEDNTKYLGQLIETMTTAMTPTADAAVNCRFTLNAIDGYFYGNCCVAADGASYGMCSNAGATAAYVFSVSSGTATVRAITTTPV